MTPNTVQLANVSVENSRIFASTIPKPHVRKKPTTTASDQRLPEQTEVRRRLGTKRGSKLSRHIYCYWTSTRILSFKELI